jgi:hypothetical protein
VVAEPDPLGGSDGLLYAVAVGRGVSAVARENADRSAVRGIVLRPIDPPLTVPLDLVWREPADPPVQQLVCLLTAPDR